MPQFETTHFISQIFWLFISFGVLVLYTLIYTIPKMRKISDERWARTEGFRIEASTASDQAKALEISRESELKSARLRAHEIMMHAKSKAAQDTRERKEASLRDLNNRLKDVENSFHKSVEESLLDLKQNLGEIVDDVTKQALSGVPLRLISLEGSTKQETLKQKHKA